MMFMTTLSQIFQHGTHDFIRVFKLLMRHRYHLRLCLSFFFSSRFWDFQVGRLHLCLENRGKFSFEGFHLTVSEGGAFNDCWLYRIHFRGVTRHFSRDLRLKAVQLWNVSVILPPLCYDYYIERLRDLLTSRNSSRPTYLKVDIHEVT